MQCTWKLYCTPVTARRTTPTQSPSQSGTSLKALPFPQLQNENPHGNLIAVVRQSYEITSNKKTALGVFLTIKYPVTELKEYCSYTDSSSN